jgi:hypothetical protein
LFSPSSTHFGCNWRFTADFLPSCHTKIVDRPCVITM